MVVTTDRRGESRWPAAAAVLVVLLVQLRLPEALVPGPRLVLPALEGALLVGLLAADPRRLTRESRDVRVLAIALVALVALANASSLIALLRALLTSGSQDGTALLASAGGIWLTNVVVFALAYWELDRGGPLGRAGAREGPGHPDLLFPQDNDPQHAPPGWHPVFADYLFVSLTAATAFSPTDTMPLTPRAKLLHGIQSVISLLTVALVTARAVNILK